MPARLSDHGHVVGDLLGRARGQQETARAGRGAGGRQSLDGLGRGACGVAALRGEAPRRDHTLYAGRRHAGPPLLHRLRFRGRTPEGAPMREPRDAIIEVNGPDVDAVIQVGTNLAMARLAGMAEFWLDKPVLAINTCIYWWSLRQNGIDDKIEGFGSLLLEH